MNNVIIVDIGNTNIKLSFCGIVDEKIINLLIIKNDNFYKEKNKIINFINKYHLTKIVLGSVCKNILNKLLMLFKNELNIPKNEIIVLKQKDFGNITSFLKEKPENIGLDILSLSYYICQKFESGIGFSFGTVSFVTIIKNKQIIGVSIAPSFYESFVNIASEASMIKNSRTSTFNIGFGYDTKSALESGYFHIINGFIQSVIKSANSQFKILNIIFCGGIQFPIEIILKDKSYNYFYKENQLVTIGYLLICKKILNIS